MLWIGGSAQTVKMLRECVVACLDAALQIPNVKLYMRALAFGQVSCCFVHSFIHCWLHADFASLGLFFMAGPPLSQTLLGVPPEKLPLAASAVFGEIADHYMQMRVYVPTHPSIPVLSLLVLSLCVLLTVSLSSCALCYALLFTAMSLASSISAMFLASVRITWVHSLTLWWGTVGFFLYGF